MILILTIYNICIFKLGFAYVPKTDADFWKIYPANNFIASNLIDHENTRQDWTLPNTGWTLLVRGNVDHVVGVLVLINADTSLSARRPLPDEMHQERNRT